MPVALNQLWQIRAICQDLEQISVNVFYFKITAITGTPDAYADFAKLIDQYTSARYSPLLPSEAKYLGVQCKLLGAPLVRMYPSSAYQVNGTSGDPYPVPRQAAAVITRYSDGDFSNPAMRGRVFMPFLPFSFVQASGNLTTAAQTLYGVFAGRMLTLNTWNNVPSTTTYELTPMMYRQVGVHYNSPITQLTLRQKVGTQKRRGSYGIPNVSPF